MAEPDKDAVERLHRETGYSRTTIRTIIEALARQATEPQNALDQFHASVCPCVAAQRYIETCPKHGFRQAAESSCLDKALAGRSFLGQAQVSDDAARDRVRDDYARYAPAPKLDDVVKRAAQAVASYVANAPEDRQQIPAIQFILNRSDEIARAALAAASEGDAQP